MGRIINSCTLKTRGGVDRDVYGKKAGRVVFSLQGSGGTSQRANGCGWGVDVCFTLNGTDVHGVAYEIYST